MAVTNEAGGGRLQVDSITGVPIELAIAGPGGRSFAFIIDWHIRVVAAAAWGFGFSLILNAVSDGAESPSGWLALLTFGPPTLIYLLYHPILELAMSGRTPGKRIAGLRIVSVEGTLPGAGALIVRNLFRFIDGLPMLYVVGLVFAFVTPRHQRIGDLAAGTLLVYEDASKADSLGSLPHAGAASGISTADAELVQDLIERWPDLDPVHRLDLARRLLARLDPGEARTQPGWLEDAPAPAWLNDTTALRALGDWLGRMR
ncbi:MAG: RDD family protein [Steroidobacteraceae bacterium]